MDTQDPEARQHEPNSEKLIEIPKWKAHGSTSSTGSDKIEQLDKKLEAADQTEVHVQALDEVVSVNSFFTVAVFIGLSFTTPGQDTSLVSSCKASSDLPKFLLVFEVISFSCYLFSSLIAQGLKLLIVLLNSKNNPNSDSASMNPNVLKLGMLVAAVGTIVGTIFLTLSMVNLIQLRLGVLSCDIPWSKWAAIPLVVMVSTGLLTFISTALFAFST